MDLLFQSNVHPVHVIFVHKMIIKSNNPVFAHMTQFKTAYGPQAITWSFLVNPPEVIQFMRVSSTFLGEIPPIIKLKVLFYGESQEHWHFIQSPTFIVQAVPGIATRLLSFLDDVNAAMNRLFIRDDTITMKFVLGFQFSSRSLATVRLTERENVLSSQQQPSNVAEKMYRMIKGKFTIILSDGKIETTRCLLYGCFQHFNNLFTEQPTATSTNVPFSCEIYKKVESAMLFSCYSFKNETKETLQEIISCLHFLNPTPAHRGHMREILNMIKHEFLIRILFQALQHWVEKPLTELISLLRVLIICNFRKIEKAVYGIIAEHFYEEFLRSFVFGSGISQRNLLENNDLVRMYLNGELRIRRTNTRKCLRRARKEQLSTKRIFRHCES